MNTPRPSRRTVIRGGAAITSLAGAWGAGAPVAAARSGPTSSEEDGGREVRLREGTNICASASPDGRMIAFDLLSVIWTLPADGGTAKPLTDDLQDATQPRWSPDGRRIVYQSYRDGDYHLWLSEADGSGEPQQLTRGPWYDMEPCFSPDGRRIVFSSDRDGSSALWTLDLTTGRTERLTQGTEVLGMPFWSPDGEKIVFTVGETAVDVLTLANGSRTRVATAPSGANVYGPAFTPDGARVIYTLFTGSAAHLILDGERVTADEDVFGFAPTWLPTGEILYTADGRIRRCRPGGTTARATEIPFTASVRLPSAVYRRRHPDLASVQERKALGIVSPALSADGRSVVFRALGALWIADTRTGTPRRITTDSYYHTDPDWAPDGRSVVYSSDRGGTANLWSYHLGTGTAEQLTDLPGGQLSPRWNHAGDRVAYQDEAGATWVLETATGNVRQVAPALYNPGRPTWSPDDSTLALAAVRPSSNRSKAGTNQVLTVRLDTGELRYQPVAERRSVSSRGGDGPVWLPDGRLAVVVDSVAHTVRVDDKGTITGPLEPLTEEVADSLSLGDGGRTLLYLSNGTLRAADLSSGQGPVPTRTLPLNLTWRRGSSRTKLVLRPDAVWDGVSRTVRRDMDVVVDGDRITALVPRGSSPAAGSRVVDLPGVTALPGLIDTHNHWHMRGGQWGDRQGRLWLSYGVTTTRSPGDPAYRIVETREAVAVGEQTGPRVLACGEALDGNRLYYSFNRPVTGRDVLERELSRATALEYDLLKTYMRFPADLSATAAQGAHAAGIPITSHYLYPNVRFGYDGQEHTAGGNRLGYTLTESRVGNAYQDAVELLATSGMWVSTTLIFSEELYAEDRSLVEDERTRTLFTPWDYKRLVAKADAAKDPGEDVLRVWNRNDVDMLLRIHRAGGLVVMGTDAPIDDVGISVHQNLRSMVAYGFTPHEALTTATTNAARAIGAQDDLGELAPGRLADIVFVAGDPLSRIDDAAAVRYVMTGGVLRSVPDLLKPFTRDAGADSADRPVNTVLKASPAVRPDAALWWHADAGRGRTCCQ